MIYGFVVKVKRKCIETWFWMFSQNLRKKREWCQVSVSKPFALYWSPMPLQEIFIHSGDVARVGSDSEFGGRRSPWPKTRWNYRRFVIFNNSKLPSRTWCTELSKHLQHPSISWNLYDTSVLLSLIGWTSPWNVNFCWFRDFEGILLPSLKLTVRPWK